MSLGNRLTLWIVGPPLLALLLVVILVLYQDAQWRQATLRDHIVTAVEQQVPEIVHALTTDTPARLDDLARRLLTIDEALSIGIYTERGAAPLELGRNRTQVATSPPQAAHFDTHGDQWHLLMPLELDAPQGEVAGQAWLELDIDSRGFTLGSYRRLATAGLGLLILGLLLFVFAASVTRRLDANLNAIAEALKQLHGGKLEARLPETVGAPELRRLAHYVNSLDDEVQQWHASKQRQVEQTTSELEESMETIEIKSIELDLAHRKALEANRIKSEFLASMSHEIRTPLNGIIGFCRLLGRSRLGERQREWLDQVHVACDNLLALVNDVLDFSRMEAGRLEFERIDLDMVTLIDEALGLQAPLAHQKGLHLLGLVYDDVPSLLRGDPLRIRQVLTNLIHNALKFTAQGEVIVRVMVEEQSEKNHILLRVGISDTGIGLTPQEQQQLFQAFRQTNASHPRQYGGSGLGLAISRQLVDQMGGHIMVESEPGQGSTFSFTLPLEVVDASEAIPEAILEGERVALYEPHVPTRHALRHLLQRWGAKVEEVSQPTLVPPYPALLVATLPNELDETALAEWRQRLEATPCPTLLLLNLSPLEMPDLPLPNGCELLSKPVPRQALIDALRRCRTAKLPSRIRPAQRARVLIVDDQAINRRLLRELLQRPELELVEAESGEEALALADNAPFQLVLMDIRMPGLDGAETTQALRQLGGHWAQCPIMAITAYASEQERQRLRTAGMQEVLAKPVNAEQLESLLQRYLGHVLPTPTTPTPTLRETKVAKDLPMVDLALGTRLADGSEELAQELLRELIGTLPQTRDDLQVALGKQDPDALLDIVHGLNGACRYCGAPELALMAETLETRLRSRGIADIEPLIDNLFAAIDRLLEWQRQGTPSSTTIATAKPASSLKER